MARISTYIANPLPQLDDKLIGTRVTGLPENNTMNFTLQALLDLFKSQGGFSVNIYNTNGTLTGNRYVTMGSYSLSFEKDLKVNTLTIGKGGNNVTTNTAFGINSLYSNTVGVRNTSIGYRSMYNNVTGSDNTSVGHYSLLSNFDGITNTAIGSYSLFSNENGSSNVAVGIESMYYNVGGDFNAAIGGYTLYSNTFGISNVAIGHTSLYTNTTGSNNVGIGREASISNSTGSFNVAIGYAAAASQDSIDESVAIGSYSLLNNYSGENNTAIGTYSLYRIYSGNRNTAVGYESMYNSELSNDTLSLGYQSLYSLYSGNNNVGIGASSLYYLEGGSDNIGLGWKSLFNLTAGDQNIGIGSNTTLSNDLDSNSIVIGYSAVGIGSNTVVLGNTSIIKTILRGYVGIGTNNPTFSLHVVGSDASVNTLKIGLGGGQVQRNVSIGATSIGESGSGNTGDYLLAIGYRPLRFNTTGRANVAIGNESMAANTTGSYNSALSIQALLRNTTGNNNTAVGVFSHIWNTTGNNNVAVGYASGNSVSGTFGSISGSYNIFLGSENYGGITTGSYNVIIGSQVTGLPSSTANNIVLADGQGNIRFRDNGVSTILSRLVGTGTRMVVVNASGELSTQTIGTGSVTGSGTTNYVPKWTSSSAIGNSLIYDNGTNVGIGTTSPSRKLDVNGDVNIASLLVVSSDIYSSGVLTNSMRANTLTYLPFLQNVSPYGEIMRVNNNGSLWINRTTDDGTGSILQVNGNATLNNAVLGQCGTYGVSIAQFSHKDRSGGDTYSILSASGGETYINAKSGQDILFRIANVDKARINSSGNVLIGETVSNGYKLQVNGPAFFTTSNPGSSSVAVASSVNQPLLAFLQAGGAAVATIGSNGGGSELFNIVNRISGGSINFYTNTSNQIVTFLSNGNVGIGNTTPAYKLDIVGNGRYSDTLWVQNYIQTNTVYTGVVVTNVIQMNTEDLVFRNIGGTTQVMKLISSNGNLILQNGGTFTDNGYRLQVYGSGWFNSDLYVRKPSSNTCYLYIGDTSNNYSNIQFTQASNFYTIGATAGGGFSFVNGANNGYIFTLASDATATFQIGNGNSANFKGKTSVNWSNYYTIPNQFVVIGNTSIGTTEALTPANNASVLFAVNSITQGVLLPRLTTAQILAITPATGLLLYNSDDNVYGFYNGTEWRKFTDQLMFP